MCTQCIYIYIYIERPIKPVQYENYDVWQNTENFKEGNFVANSAFLVSRFRSFLTETRRYAALYTNGSKVLRRCCRVDMAVH
jgi:hypothetical protein